MKKTLFLATTWLIVTSSFSQESLDYFLPSGTSYDDAIPSPESFFGFQIGEYHLTHDKLVNYMQALAAASDRVSIEYSGWSYEMQPIITVVISSPSNHNNLEKLRTDHLAVLDPNASPNAIRNDPTIVWLGYSVHGNEPSGANAAPLVAYYLAAGQSSEVRAMLDECIILIDPCQNPDGLNRFAYWVNQKKSMNNNPDLNSMEFSEGWPGSRSNHYWFDLNRDWMALQNVETRARIAQFHRWKPHIATDHHEMGSSSTFFFQPGVADRSNPVVPPGNYTLTQKVGIYHAKELDEIGSLYYTEEVFDDFYFGKGSAYPDVNGSIGILFEQASSRGHLRPTANGMMTFAYTIRNQVKSSISTLKASVGLEKELKFHQIDFYHSAWDEAKASPVKGYLFGDTEDPYRNQLLVDILLQHQITVMPVRENISIQGQDFKEGASYFVPAEQMQYRMVRTLFEKVTDFNSTTFYDVSGWTLPLAMGIPYAEVDERLAGRIKTSRELTEKEDVRGKLTGAVSPVGYLFPSSPYLTHKALYELFSAGIRVKISKASFKLFINNELVTFGAGTLFVPVQNQSLSSDEIYQLLDRMALDYGLEVYTAPTGYTIDGPDLGSGQFSSIQKPDILCLAGGSVSSRDIGEAWHLLDTRFSIPLTLADISRFSRLDLDQYNTLYLGGGSYSELGDNDINNLKTWIRKGGKVVAVKSAASFLARIGVVDLNRIEGADRPDLGKTRPWAMQRADRTGWSIPGTIFNTELDTTHPLAYGYHQSTLPVFKSGSGFYELSDNPYENVAVYTENPLMSGYINEAMLPALAGSSAIQRQSFGRGKVILFFDNPVFRGFWAAEHKMLLNALFWGNL